MTHSSSYVWYDSFLCVTWLIHTCDVTHAATYVSVTWLLHTYDMDHSYVWCDSSIGWVVYCISGLHAFTLFGYIHLDTIIFKNPFECLSSVSFLLFLCLFVEYFDSLSFLTHFIFIRVLTTWPWLNKFLIIAIQLFFATLNKFEKKSTHYQFSKVYSQRSGMFSDVGYSSESTASSFIAYMSLCALRHDAWTSWFLVLLISQTIGLRWWSPSKCAELVYSKFRWVEEIGV